MITSSRVRTGADRPITTDENAHSSRRRFAQAIADAYISAETADHVLTDTERMAAAVAASAAPFDESHWLNWRPPSEWTVPALPVGWDRVSIY